MKKNSFISLFRVVCKIGIFTVLTILLIIPIFNNFIGINSINSVVAEGVSKPVVTVSPKVAYLYHKSTGNDPLITEKEALVGVSAYDSIDGDITSRITIDKLPIFYGNANPGQYSIQYNVRNSSGQSGYMSRSYQVGYEPKINANNVTKKIGENVSASDFEASATNFNNQSASIYSDFSQVDFNKPGVYPVTFSSKTGKPYATNDSDINQYITVYLTLTNSQSKVIVKYIDVNGNVIAENEDYTGNIGDDYTSEQKNIPGYTFKEVRGNPAGQFTSDEQVITYVYTKNPVIGSNVIVKYIDDKGNKISDSIIKNGNIGDKYITEQKNIPGYTFKEVQGNPVGQFTSDEQVITYVYTKNPVIGSNVIVKYIDDKGNKISDSIIKNGNIGDKYITEQKNIPGYTFKEVQGNPVGQFTSDEQVITYVYTKNPVIGSNVIVKYIDDKGNKISDSIIKNGNIGDKYTTEQKNIPGYTFKEVQGNPAGQFTSDEQVITYVYTKDKPSITKGVIPTGKNISKTQSKESNNVSGMLPQTGDSKKSAIVVSAIGLLLLLASASILKNKKTSKKD
ncbi:MucBP domain-containing protein [Lactococcus lactis]|uniref:MucBP domain-containing protein n=1 Tax=Lactococcus lactis TaxID=1358 RepID=UPI0023A9C3EB|nr:MucBP domain-containing protein [Lactococcus lactis]WEA55297.1 MucBP domain-containing protein [Lactococcus lactis]